MPITCAKPKAPENGGVSADGEYGILCDKYQGYHTENNKIPCKKLNMNY